MDLRAVAIGQIVVLIVFGITWVGTGLNDTTGSDPGDAATVAVILGSLPAFVTGVIAGLVAAARPKIRRVLLIGFALLAAIGAGVLYSFVAPRCGIEVDGTSGLLSRGESCANSWKDAAGIFLGAEFAIAFQFVAAWLFAGMVRKYPLRRPVP